MITVTGMDDALRLMRNFPGDTKKNQKVLIAQSARKLRFGVKARLKASAPRRSGRLQRSIRVRVDNARPSMIISGSRALVPVNKKDGYLSRELKGLPNRMDDAVVDIIQKRIRKLTEGN